jgi:hypothetical protein
VGDGAEGRDDRVESGDGIEQCNYALVVGWLGLALCRGGMCHAFIKHSLFVVCRP